MRRGKGIPVPTTDFNEGSSLKRGRNDEITEMYEMRAPEQKSSIFKIVIIILVLGLICGFCFLLYSKRKNEIFQSEEAKKLEEEKQKLEDERKDQEKKEKGIQKEKEQLEIEKKEQDKNKKKIEEEKKIIEKSKKDIIDAKPELDTKKKRFESKDIPKLEEEQKKNKEYIESCQKGKSDSPNFKGVEVGKDELSILIPVMEELKSKEDLMPLIRSIQYQSFKNLDILFLLNQGNSKNEEIINTLKSEVDGRINTFINDQNEEKGYLNLLYRGIKKAKADYIFIMNNIDDLILEDTLSKGMGIIKKESLDILEYNIYNGDLFLQNGIFSKELYDSEISNQRHNHKTELIKQPELGYMNYYLNGKPHQNCYEVFGKIIKKGQFIYTLRRIKDFYLKENIVNKNLVNLMLLFVLHRDTVRYRFNENYGYYTKHVNTYLLDSFINNDVEKEELNKNVKEIFTYLKFNYEITFRLPYEKKWAYWWMRNVMSLFTTYTIEKLTKENLILCKEVSQIYIDCDILYGENKTPLIEFQSSINQKLNEIKNKEIL